MSDVPPAPSIATSRPFCELDASAQEIYRTTTADAKSMLFDWESFSRHIKTPHVLKGERIVLVPGRVAEHKICQIFIVYPKEVKDEISITFSAWKWLC